MTDRTKAPAPWVCLQCDAGDGVVELAVCALCEGVVCPHHYRRRGDERAICMECIDKALRLEAAI